MHRFNAIALRGNRLIRHTYVLTFITQSLILTIGLLNSILLSRTLGAEGRGEIAAITIVPSILNYLGALGVIDAMLYQGTQREYLLGKVYITSSFLIIIQGIISAILCMGVVEIVLARHPLDVIITAKAFSWIIPLNMIAMTNANALRAQLKMHYYNIVALVMPCSTFTLTLLLFVLGALSVQSVVLLQATCTLLTVLLSYLFIFRTRILLDISFSWPLAKELYSFGAKVYVGSVFAMANLRLDQLIMASVVDAQQLGLYAVSVSVSAISGIVVVVFTTVSMPRISLLPDMAARKEAVVSVFQRHLVVSGAIKFGLILILPVLFPLVYGSEFAQATPILLMLIIGSFFYDFKQLLTSCTQALNNPSLSSRTELVGIVVTLVLLFILLPKFGILGAAIASIIAYFTSFLMMLYLIWHEHDIHPLRFFALRISR